MVKKNKAAKLVGALVTANQVIELAKAVADVARALKSAQVLSEQVNDYNSVKAIDWGALTPKDQTDPVFNVDGLTIRSTEFSPDQISNALGSIAAFNAYWDQHGQNFQMLTNPIV